MTDSAAAIDETLPTWDLKDLYAGIDDPAVAADLARAEELARGFTADLGGKVATLDAAGMVAAIRRFEALDELLSRLASFAQLTRALDLADPEVGRFAQMIQERLTDITATTLFFTLEINKIEDSAAARLLADPALGKYARWLEDTRAFRPHQLSDEIEKLLHEKYVAGRAAWNRLFDETMADLRVDYRGESKTSTEALNLMVDRDATVRRDAARAFGKSLGEHGRIFALITNTLAKDKEIEDRWRGHARPISARNLANRVEDSVVDALISSVRAAYPSLSHRYYRLKARWFGVEQLDWWDRNAPLPAADDKIIPWPDARRVVLGAYHGFSPELGKIADPFFEKGWIDAPITPVKSPGAFAHPTVPSAHPYLLLNYQGKTRDVMTLAHELGHGVHQVLAGRAQGHLLADTPLTLAETASVFGEMLTFQALLAAETDPVAKRWMLASKVEDMLNTAVRQIALHGFEERVHAERRKGELTPDDLGKIWLECQTESLGSALRFDEDYRHFWAYIPHFIHSPFYVYAYAFGDCLVNSLYAVYQDAAPGFAEKYLDMLRAGGSRRHKELLAPFGLDAGDPAFWSKGLGVISGFIDQLEAGA